MRHPATRDARARVNAVLRVPAAAALFATAVWGVTGISAPAEAKAPGHTYCFYSTCHRVKSLVETAALVGRDATLNASFYDSCKVDRYNPCGLTSSGEVFRPEAADNAASPIYPDGTMLLVWSPETQQALVVRVNNAGPYWGDRKLDLSRAAAEKLGFKHRGVAKVRVRVISAPGKEEATYRRGRTYDPVPGHIGRYDTLDDAYHGMANVFAMSSLSASLLTPLTGGAIPMTRSAGSDTIPMIVAAAKTPAALPVLLARAAPKKASRTALAFNARKARERQMAQASHLQRAERPVDLAGELVRTATYVMDELNKPFVGAPRRTSRVAAKSQRAVRIARAAPAKVRARVASAAHPVRLAEQRKAQQRAKALAYLKPRPKPAIVETHRALNGLPIAARSGKRATTVSMMTGQRKVRQQKQAKTARQSPVKIAQRRAG